MREKRNRSFLAAGLLFTVMALAVGPAAAGDDQAAERLGRAISFQTISYQDPAQLDPAPFQALHEFLQTAFPLIHQRLTREEVGLSLLYTWKGTDPAAKPIIFLAHQDVVPIAPGTVPDWTAPPFEGRIQDGFIWGRGTMDCKGILMAVMESVEGLLAAGYQPRRTVYLAFGQDEEVGGDLGAAKIAALLQERGVTAEYIVDESGMIVDGKVVGIKKPLAMIGIAEKGYLTLELTVRAKGGHSSMPPRESAISILAEAVTKVQRHRFPARVDGVTAMAFKALAPEMPGALGFAVKNQWLFGGLLKSFLAKQPATDAMIRTTTAVTIINAGSKENVLPQEARAVVNFRLLPGDNVAGVTAEIIKAIDDPRVEVKPVGRPREPSIVSRTDSDGWRLLTGTIKELFPAAAMAPYLVLGGTDARQYEGICDSIYRFAPMRLGVADEERAHGTNERIGVENYHEMIKFYATLVRNSDK